ncbi:MAG: hypothetical protein EA403_16565 [Spirochaetaceae bacterium]|nr:MAG: hypothetical protein EA403_16565 [Spirochaetaceae bacterium]
MTGQRRCAAIAVALLMAALPLSAMDFIVRYSEGTVELQRQTAWAPLLMGDLVPGDAVMRLSQGAYAELGDGRTVLRLAQPGVFRMSDLLGGRRAVASPTVTSMIQGRVERLAEQPRTLVPVVGGTRAVEAPRQGDIEWVGGESVEELIAEGRDALVAGDLDSAFDLFDEAMLYATADEEAEVAFYLGYTLALSGEPRGALHWLQMHTPNPDAGWFHEHTLALAQVQLDLSMTSDTVALLSRYASSSQADRDTLPSVHLLLGVAHRMGGDASAARRELERVRSLAPGTDLASVAAGMLAEL